MAIITVGIDLAKNVFAVHSVLIKSKERRSTPVNERGPRARLSSGSELEAQHDRL